MKLFDLTSIASSIDEPFRIVSFASLGAIEVGLVICEGPKSWHRSLERRELALVLEGVITIDRPTVRVVANEGSIVSLPPGVGLTTTSGMRSTVVVFKLRTPSGETNGFHAPQELDDKGVLHVSFASEALQGNLNQWRPAGDVGIYSASATRMAGDGEPFIGPEGDMMLMVYRGVVDYQGEEDGESGSVVGSQAILVPKDHALSLTAPRGATVIALARAAAVLPTVAVPTPADDDSDGHQGDGGGPEPAV